MMLLVRVIEARNIPAMDPNGFSDPYVKLQLGKQRFKTKVVKKCLNPSWNEEFGFRVEDLNEELVVDVLDEDKYSIDDFVGRVRVPIHRVFDTNDKSLGSVWYPLQPKNKKTSKNRDCGEILLAISFTHRNSFMDLLPLGNGLSQSRDGYDVPVKSPSRSSIESTRSVSPLVSDDVSSFKDSKLHSHALTSRIAQIFNKSGGSASSCSSKGTDSPEVPEKANSEVNDHQFEGESVYVNFEELMKKMESIHKGSETPSNLPGGVLLDQLYSVAPHEMNSLLFSPESDFVNSLADVLGNTELLIEPWKFLNDGESLKRVVTYLKAATRLIKALKTTEEQTYLKADGRTFAVLASVTTPDAPYGSNYRAEVLYCISPGPELPSGEECTRLEVSWRMNFLQNTMMKGMIESGARQGLKECFEQYASLLAQKVKQIEVEDTCSDDKAVLTSLQVEHQSGWKLAFQFFANLTVVSTFFMGAYVLLHIWLTSPNMIQGLEFVGFDLPDSIGEVIVCGVLFFQCQRVVKRISRFLHARGKKGSDHGVKAQGSGWLLTVALIEGSNLPFVDSSGFSDPFVVFTCNGKTKTSSIRFQKSDPQWHEIFEFGAMDEPPSMLRVDVNDFDGSFESPTLLGYAEINFLKVNISDLADVWIPLQGNHMQACQSKLHLRILLTNTKGSDAVKDYLIKMEKEVGRKIRLRSPQTNSAFQKLFGLPPEEFLINDFSCHLKRKMPLQGRLYLSARILGFYSDLFGHKTKFFFLWEDIEDILVVTPTLSSMGSPIIIMTLWLGKGLDARHGAKTQDEEGRLKFHFHSFVSFGVAHRTIMALWKARALSPKQKERLIEEQNKAKSLKAIDDDSDTKSFPTEEGCSSSD